MIQEIGVHTNKVLKSHLYQLKYKGKYVVKFNREKPLNKKEWVLSDDPYSVSPYVSKPTTKDPFIKMYDWYLKDILKLKDPNIELLDCGRPTWHDLDKFNKNI